MRKVLLIGGGALAPSRRGPGAVAEAAAVKRMIQGAPGGRGPAVIAVIDPERPASFDPAMGLDDFVVKTASPAELALRIRQALWRRTGVDARHVLRCGDLEMDLAHYNPHVGGPPVGRGA